VKAAVVPASSFIWVDHLLLPWLLRRLWRQHLLLLLAAQVGRHAPLRSKLRLLLLLLLPFRV